MYQYSLIWQGQKDLSVCGAQNRRTQQSLLPILTAAPAFASLYLPLAALGNAPHGTRFWRTIWLKKTPLSRMLTRVFALPLVGQNLKKSTDWFQKTSKKPDQEF